MSDKPWTQGSIDEKADALAAIHDVTEQRRAIREALESQLAVLAVARERDEAREKFAGLLAKTVEFFNALCLGLNLDADDSNNGDVLAEIDCAGKEVHRLSREVADLRTERDAVREELIAARAEVERVRDAIHRDQTGLAAALERVSNEIAARHWIAESRGCYEWDDDRYKEEAGSALRLVQQVVLDALHVSGRLARAALSPAPPAKEDPPCIPGCVGRSHLIDCPRGQAMVARGEYVQQIVATYEPPLVGRGQVFQTSPADGERIAAIVAGGDPVTVAQGAATVTWEKLDQRLEERAKSRLARGGVIPGPGASGPEQDDDVPRCSHGRAYGICSQAPEGEATCATLPPLPPGEDGPWVDRAIPLLALALQAAARGEHGKASLIAGEVLRLYLNPQPKEHHRG